MTDSIYVLDFRRGTVEKTDNSGSPTVAQGAAGTSTDQARSGHKLASLGSPPQPAEE